MKSLPNLQVLKFFCSHAFVDDKLMKDLQDLKHLKILTATIEDATILKSIQKVDRLAKSIQDLCLQNMSAPHVTLSTVALGGLQRLGILRCNISEIKIDGESTSPGFNDLSTVFIGGLKGQRDLTWLLYAQNLRYLTVEWSSEIEEIINKDKVTNIIDVPFEMLESLSLYQLAGLTEICWNFSTLPRCRKFDIRYCPKLPEATTKFPRHAEE